MHSNLLDSHVYIVSRWVLDYMTEHLKNALSFKREVLPHLIKNQDSKSEERRRRKRNREREREGGREKRWMR